MILKHQLRWAGHVSRMEDHHLPKIVSLVRRTLHWPSWGRGSKEAIQGQPEEVAHYLQHRPQAVVWPCCWPCGLAPQNPLSCCPVRSGQKKFTRRKETDEEGLRRLHHHIRHYFSLQTLLAALSLPHRSGQPRACNVDKLNKSSFAKPSHETLLAWCTLLASCTYLLGVLHLVAWYTLLHWCTILAWCTLLAWYTLLAWCTLLARGVTCDFEGVRTEDNFKRQRRLLSELNAISCFFRWKFSINKYEVKCSS